MAELFQGEADPLPIPHVAAYRLARETWHYMLTDDDACRDICDREAFLSAEMADKYPGVPERDRQWLAAFALDAVIARFHD